MSVTAVNGSQAHAPTIAEIADIFREPDDERLRVHPCAWCLKDRGEAAKDSDSHGICRRHGRDLLRSSLANRLWEVVADLSGPAYLDESRRLKLAATARRVAELLQEDDAWAV